MPRKRRMALIVASSVGLLVAREARLTAAHQDPALRAQAIRRKVAVATWRAPTEGRLMTRLVIDAEPLQAYVASRRAAGARGLTIMHVVGVAAAKAVRAIPDGNARVLGSRIVPMKDISIAFAVDIGTGTDLAPCKIDGADHLTPAQMADQVWAGVKALRAGTHDGFNTSTRIAAYVPGVLMRPLLMVMSTVLGGLDRPMLGQRGTPLGSVFISNVAPLAVEEVFLAPVPFARTPVYISMGIVTDRAVVREGQVTVVPQFTMCLTGDHRLVDGVQCAIYFDALKRYLADPESLGG